MSLARRERKGYGRSSIRGNHMNFSCPSASGLSDRLWPVFFSAPVPSGCTFTAVLSSDIASMLRRMICASCRLLEHAFQRAVLGPPTQPNVDRVPVSEPFWQGAPLAPVLGDVKNRVQHLQVRQRHVPTLKWKMLFDLCNLFCGKFHHSSIAENHLLVLTRPRTIAPKHKRHPRAAITAPRATRTVRTKCAAGAYEPPCPRPALTR